MVLRPSSSIIILGGLLFLVTLSRSVHGHNEPYTDDPYLQSQFLKPAEEIEAAGEKFKDDHADITEVCYYQEVWVRVSKEWMNELTNAWKDCRKN